MRSERRKRHKRAQQTKPQLFGVEAGHYRTQPREQQRQSPSRAALHAHTNQAKSQCGRVVQPLLGAGTQLQICVGGQRECPGGKGPAHVLVAETEALAQAAIGVVEVGGEAGKTGQRNTRQ